MMKNEALWMKAAQSNVVTTDCGSLNRASDSEITLFWLFKGHPLKGHICAKGWANRIPLVSYTNLPLRYCPHTFPDSQVTSNTMVRKTVYNFGAQFFHGLSCSCSVILFESYTHFIWSVILEPNPLLLIEWDGRHISFTPILKTTGCTDESVCLLVVKFQNQTIGID